MPITTPQKILITSLFILATITTQAADWPSYGGDNGSQKYSPLDQIDAGNVSSLATAWSWDSVDNVTVAINVANDNARATPAGYKATPIVVGDVMYVPTSFGRIVALDAVNGAEKWVFDTRAWEAGQPTNLGYNTRGVAYWEEGGEERIFFATNDSTLWSIDVESG